MDNKSSRRDFLKQSSFAGIGTVLSMGVAGSVFATGGNEMTTPAILGGNLRGMK
jgi:anaerobic selenocysteine-containing dehydrogenase